MLLFKLYKQEMEKSVVVLMSKYHVEITSYSNFKIKFGWEYAVVSHV